ncbi:hypothetical protein [Streptomyces sp. HB132]|uniref:hypothetical protein n=1 Tax=Streptomyces sp. HB132 TaxID=767388 RepID=UPI001961C684|nr:hypothetical protein [Streptomyces sp. HB132]MBM7439389.1 hypothetical protein [Streptomyces sp. HB132]
MKKNNPKKALVAGAALAVVLVTPVAAEATPAPATSRLADLGGTSLDPLATYPSILSRALDRVNDEAPGVSFNSSAPSD